MLTDSPHVHTQAAQRHAAFRPALEAAQAALQQWLTASCAAPEARNVRAALQTHTAEHPANPPSNGAQPPMAGVQGRAPIAAPAEAGKAGSRHLAAIDAGGAAQQTELDFAALGHMKAVVQPMLTWDSPDIASARHDRRSASSTTVGSRAAEQQEDYDVPHESGESVTHGGSVSKFEDEGVGPPRRCNLYDMMVHNDDGEDAVALAHEVLRQAPSLPQPLLRGSKTCVGPKNAREFVLTLNAPALPPQHARLAVGARASRLLALTAGPCVQVHVVLPRRSSFVMSDITRLRPLISGTPVLIFSGNHPLRSLESWLARCVKARAEPHKPSIRC